MAVPGVVLKPRARVFLQRGIDQMARLVRVTLGPRARNVAIAPQTAGRAPELLNDGGTIARRILEFPDRYETMGAMLIRQLAWNVRKEVGDGSATAVVLAQAIVTEANRYVAAGGNPMMLKRGIERGLDIVEVEIDSMARHIDDPSDRTTLITGVTGDPQLGEMFGEIYDIVGKDGVVIVQDSRTTITDREYIEGVQWDRGYISPYMATNTDRMEAVLEDPPILLTNRVINSSRELVGVLEKVRQAGFKSLFIVAGDVSGDALSLLVVNKMKGVLTTLAAKAPGYGDRRTGILGDLAILTGARVINEDAGETLADVRIEDLGRARRVWADKGSFNVIGGYGDPAAVRKRIAEIKVELPTIDDEYERGKARERLGKLVGGVAVVNVGAHSEAAQKEKRVRVDAAVAAMRAAVEGGVVPGGGSAFLSCIPSLQKIKTSGDDAMAVEILISALEAPTRWIVANAGFEPNPILAELRGKPRGWGFDVLDGEFKDMVEAGILDPHRVVRVALEKSISIALVALTTDALVARRKPLQSYEP